MRCFEIVDAKLHHCGQMARLLRTEHHIALAKLGINTHRELRARFDESAFRKAWMVDGQLAGLGGVMGSRLATTGFLWLALSQRATRYPIAIVREARRQLDDIMLVKRELATTIINGDDAAKRLAIFLGFHVSHEGRGARAFSRFGRRDLARFVETDQDSRIPIGTNFVVAMGYHHEDHV